MVLSTAERSRRYTERHPEKRQASNRQYDERNREYRALWARERNARVRAELLEALGNKCRRCGFRDARALQVDHVNGGGTKHLKSVKRSTWSYYLDVRAAVKANTGEYQLLCANCNFIKRETNSELTHRKY